MCLVWSEAVKSVVESACGESWGGATRSLDPADDVVVELDGWTATDRGVHARTECAETGVLSSTCSVLEERASEPDLLCGILLVMLPHIP